MYVAMELNWKRLTRVGKIWIKNAGVLGMLGLLLVLSGQVGPEKAPRAQELLDKGNVQWKATEYAEAYDSWNQAAESALEAGDTLRWATATQSAGKYLVQEMKSEAAITTLDKVLGFEEKWGALHPVMIAAKLERALLALRKNEMEEALNRYQELVTECRKSSSLEDSLLASVYEPVGKALFFSGQYDSALSYSHIALKLFEAQETPNLLAIANTHNTLGGINLYSGKPDQALKHYLRTRELREQELGSSHPEVIKVTTNLGVVYGEMGLYWESLAYHEQNLPFLDKLPPLAHLNGLLNLGSALIAVGNYEEALTFLNQGENYLQQFPDLSPSAYPYINLYRSVIHEELGQNELALTYMNIALEGNQKIYGERHPALIPEYLQQGSLLATMGDYSGAVKANQQVVSLAREFVGPQSLRAGHALNYLGDIYAKLENPRESLRYYQEAAEMYAVIGNDIDRAHSLVNSARAWQSLSNWEKAQEALQLAWQLQLPELPYQLVADQQVLAYWRRHKVEDVFEVQTHIFQTQYAATQDSVFLLAGLASAEIALSAVDSMRHYHQAAGVRHLWLEEQLPLYEAAVGFAFELYQLTGREAFAEKVFTLTEKRKANTLRDHLRGMQALEFAGVPDSLILQERFFRQRLTALDAQVSGIAPDSILQQERFTLNQRYKALIHELEVEYPRYHHLKYASPALTKADMIEHLSPQQVLYSYLWGEEYIYLSHWAQGEITANRIKRDSVFQQAFEGWLAFISQAPKAELTDYTSIAEQGTYLAQVLLPDLDADMEQLLLIPDGNLSYLPFESLLTANPSASDFRNWPFLTLDWAMTYAYAGEVWLQQQEMTVSSEPATYLGFAPDFESPSIAAVRSELGSLVFNQEEVRRVADLLGGEASLGNEAREEMLKRLGGENRILHFATHAIADNEQQVNSRLYFSLEGASEEDGVLYAHEIYGLNLNSPLTVLSACQTGKGPILRGEGVMSLARAFQYSGSQRVLTTLWKTDDRAGASLTTSFFESIAAQLSPQQALKAARLAWLDQSDSYHCHPYYWSGYVLIGEGGTIHLAQSRWYTQYWIWIVGIGFLLPGILWIFRKKN